METGKSMVKFLNMNDLSLITLSSTNISEKLYFTVKEITYTIKKFIDSTFSTALWIEGEITNLRYAQNGNIYFNLTEKDASLKAIIFSDNKHEVVNSYLKNGLKVLCFGRLNFYPKTGECYFIVRRVEPIGKGLLEIRKEELLKKYRHYFDPNRKRTIPSYPKKIAIITSLFGAALQDFIKIGKDRWDLDILIYPVRVQGEGAEKEIVQAIKDINTYFEDVDLIVITRGGGSYEDLAPFYTEEIIIGIINSKIPVVSAVGHEIDYTICDMIADKRCPTPSAAAQQIIPDKEKMLEKLFIYTKKYKQALEIILSKKERDLYSLKLNLHERNPIRVLYKLERELKDRFYNLCLRIREILTQKESKINSLKLGLRRHHPLEKVKREEEKLNGYKKRLEILMDHYLELQQKRLQNLLGLLNSLSPLKVLERGYSIVRSLEKEKVIKMASDLEIGERLEIRFSKGRALVEVLEIKEE